jgi:hypothetical protein
MTLKEIWDFMEKQGIPGGDFHYAGDDTGISATRRDGAPGDRYRGGLDFL